jgi:hypothetical protein
MGGADAGSLASMLPAAIELIPAPNLSGEFGIATSASKPAVSAKLIQAVVFGFIFLLHWLRCSQGR